MCEENALLFEKKKELTVIRELFALFTIQNS